MTIPAERYRSLVNMRWHLLNLLALPRVTKKELRRTVKMILRHYPTDYEINQLAKARPDIIDARGER